MSKQHGQKAVSVAVMILETHAEVEAEAIATSNEGEDAAQIESDLTLLGKWLQLPSTASAFAIWRDLYIGTEETG
jgi:hypothetical protein